eukprot:2819126-Rhodomonas_salina.1
MSVPSRSRRRLWTSGSEPPSAALIFREALQSQLTVLSRVPGSTKRTVRSPGPLVHLLVAATSQMQA